ncbi:hypothetical protein [Nocardioides perillae]|uniref:Right handed beta helix region n=1 Tax=Nocardioides perillae TaxID=1119534 RepID=A0A7Y9USH0_9ACTN|nr:hypothetical protein [Nocardioides perillae]NYG55784.1 hypothetical protein [Nocardioides perillae]
MRVDDRAGRPTTPLLARPVRAWARAARALGTTAVAGVAALAVAGSSPAAAPTSAGTAPAVGAAATVVNTTAPAPTLAAVASATGRTYYVAPTGSDSNPGTSAAAPLRSLAAASALALRPGDRLLLRRGGAWTGDLRVDDAGTALAPVTVSSYGRGPLPRVQGCLRLAADHQVLHQVHVDGCTWSAVQVAGDHALVYNVEATGSFAGIEVEPETTGARLLRNWVRDNDRMAPGTTGSDDDYGAHGILVRGDQAEVAWNHISGHLADSPDYGTDGAALEVYGAVGTRIHHNVAVDNRAFLELGHSRTRDTRVSYNVSRTSVPLAEFVITRGADPTHGGVLGTVVAHNTAKHSGAGSQAFWCAPGCAPDVLALEANVFDITGRIGWADGPLGGRDNLYWGSGVEHTLLPGDLVADPRFASPATGDLHLSAGSPAVDSAGALLAARASSPTDRVDADGRRLPRDGDGDRVAVLDRGAFER